MVVREEDSYQGMPSGMPSSVQLGPALAAAVVLAKTQRLKPFASPTLGGIAKALP